MGKYSWTMLELRRGFLTQKFVSFRQQTYWHMNLYVFTGYATEMAQHAGAALSVAAPRRHQPTISLSERHPDVRCEATSSAAPYWR
jgi:hypothetical protein